MKHFTVLLILSVLLSGCVHKDATETIIDENVNHFNQVLDYTHDTFEQTKEIVYLEDQLKSCTLVLSSAKESHKTVIEKCETETNYWKLLSGGLGLLVGMLVFFGLKKKIWL